MTWSEDRAGAVVRRELTRVEVPPSRIDPGAVLIAGRDLYINANSTVVGQIIAGRNIILNSNCTIIMADVL